MEARLAHPIFKPYRKWLAKLSEPLAASVADLTALADEAGIRVASGAPLRFVVPSSECKAYGAYERRVFESGRVETRPGSLHDLFNALAWLAFPRTKARLNALHTREIPREQGRRGRLRDLLTLVDEGGAIVRSSNAELRRLVHDMNWRALFWQERDRLGDFQIQVVGHAVLERALAPWPGIVCKVVFVDGDGDPDELASQALEDLPLDAAPRTFPVLPIFGYPGWDDRTAEARFYDDEKYFRRARWRRPGIAAARRMGAESRPGSRCGNAEESPGSAEQDAG